MGVFFLQLLQYSITPYDLPTMSLRKVPPLAAPVPFSGWLRSCVLGLGARDACAEFAAAFCDDAQLERCWLTNTGRAALYLLLRALTRLSPRRRAVIPAYTCPTVALSAARAGLEVQLCDVTLEDLSIDVEQLEKVMDERTLCVIVIHPFGYPCDIVRACEVARGAGAFLVENCAQAVHTRFNGQPVGTFGDASVFSMGRGKPFSIYDGGIVAVPNAADSNLTDALEQEWQQAREAPAFSSVTQLVKFAAMQTLGRPWAWGVVSRLPLGFEQQTYPMDFPVHRLARWQGALALVALKAASQTIATRRANGQYLAARLRERLGQNPRRVRVPAPREGATCTYLRLPILTETPAQRERLFNRLHRAGIGVSRVHQRALMDYEYLQPFLAPASCPNARRVSETLIGLPTHPLMGRKDLERIVEVVSDEW